MNPFLFHAPTRITFGEGVASGACETIKDAGGTNIILITDKQLANTPAVKGLLEQWQKEKVFL